MRRTSLVIISLLLCIALSVPALAAGELDAFQRTANDAAAFSDVPAGSWQKPLPRPKQFPGRRQLPSPLEFTPPVPAWKSPLRMAHGTNRMFPTPQRQSFCHPPARRAPLFPPEPSPGRSWQDCLQTFCPRSRCLPSTTAPFRTLPPWTRNFAARSG